MVRGFEAVDVDEALARGDQQVGHGGVCVQLALKELDRRHRAARLESDPAAVNDTSSERRAAHRTLAKRTSG
jgi:hypothetical protein